MKVLLLQLDGKIPNIALMRIAAHHRAAGDDIELRRDVGSVERGLFDDADKIYASLIFEKTRWKAERLMRTRPDAVIGGTGWDLTTTIESIGITTQQQDYTVYPEFRSSIGFSQRGCSLNCSFCVVPRKEGKPRPEKGISEIWRGDPWPRELILLDNDFFGVPDWPQRISEIQSGGFKVSFNQGINARMLNDETAAAVASVRYYDDGMKTRRIYTAWDNRRDERRLFAGLEALVRYGVKPDHIMIYILIGYDHSRREARPYLTDDDFFRQAKLRQFGARPYPMPFIRTREIVGFQRWVIGAYDKSISWNDWRAARFEPRNLDLNTQRLF